LDGAADAAALPAAPKLGGIDVTKTFDATGTCRLTLTLLDPVLFEMFRVLCHDLLSSTADMSRGDNGRGLFIVLQRLHRWQELLRRRRDDVLTKQQIIGLVGELCFLRDKVFPAIGSEAVASWRGSYGDEQDFVHGGWIFEIKTQLSTSDQRIYISSEAQLDISSGNIALCHQTLGATSPDDPASRSLNEIVDEIGSALGSPDAGAVLEFELALLEANYVNRPEYDEGRWIVASRRFYVISDGFPRITPSTLAAGIERVSYHIRVEACRAFEVDGDALMEQVFGRRT
jgi:hypothetical protein